MLVCVMVRVVVIVTKGENGLVRGDRMFASVPMHLPVPNRNPDPDPEFNPNLHSNRVGD